MKPTKEETVKQEKKAYIPGIKQGMYPIATPRNQSGLKRDIVEIVLNMATPDDDCMLSDFLHVLQYVLDKHHPTRIAELESRISDLESILAGDRHYEQIMGLESKLTLREENIDSLVKKHEECLADLKRKDEALNTVIHIAKNCLTSPNKKLYKLTGIAEQALKSKP